MPQDNRLLFEILLVEDDENDAATTISVLSHEGLRCRVSTAEDGVEALAILYKTGKYANAPTPSLMLLDLTLPSKGGLEVLREIRKSDTSDLKNLPVVILTASTDFGDAKEALNLGVTSYMSKPVKVDDLVAAVKRLLDKFDLAEKQRADLEGWEAECRRFG